MDIGYVGDVEHVDTAPLLDLIGKGMVPVVAPIGRGPEGESFNVNADTAAGEIAAALHAEKLVFLTDVQGIMRDLADDASLLSTVHVSEVGRLIDQDVICGGMIPKVEACVKSVKAGGAQKPTSLTGACRMRCCLSFTPGRALAPKLSNRTTEKTMKTEDIIRGEAQYILQTYGRPEFCTRKRQWGLSLRHGRQPLISILSVVWQSTRWVTATTKVLKAIESTGRQVDARVQSLPHNPLGRGGKAASRALICRPGVLLQQRHRGVGRPRSSFAASGATPPTTNPKNRLIAFENSFHGRTYGSISTTGQPKYHKGFEPLLPGIDFAQFNDLASVESLASDQTCAILVEPVQAEGGINAATAEFLTGLRAPVRRAGYAAGLRRDPSGCAGA